jgi:hypothetical protein
MRRLVMTAMMLAMCVVAASAQSPDDLNIQIHGYATQGFLYTTNNNILTTTSSNGSPDWTEAVLNISAQPTSKLRVSVQGRYELLGNYANQITLDYAFADYKQNDKFGVRFGKVKVPSGLFNEIQDIDPSYQWALLPQSVYPIASRNSLLSLFGGVAYGVLNGGSLGKLEYRDWSGETVLASNDGYFLSEIEAGLNLPHGLTNIENGAALHWKTPLPGLMIGASDSRKNTGHAPATAGNGVYPGTATVTATNIPQYFAKYEKDKLMVASEFERARTTGTGSFGAFTESAPVDYRAFYGMASYKLTERLTSGVYYSQFFDKQAALGPARYQKDWAISARYDFNQFLYAKAEEHFLNGTGLSYDVDLNPAGLRPTTKLTILKVGVSF